MQLHLFEATNGMFWGKFAVGKPGSDEWRWRSQVADPGVPVLAQLGWDQQIIWVTDLATGEGAIFHHGGLASADLAQKHPIRVGLLFEPFLDWLYHQDIGDLAALPKLITVPGIPFDFSERGAQR